MLAKSVQRTGYASRRGLVGHKFARTDFFVTPDPLSGRLQDIIFYNRAAKHYIGVRSGMATQLEIPLPEIQVQDFKRAWTRFELVAKAKSEEWDEGKQLTVIPMNPITWQVARYIQSLT